MPTYVKLVGTTNRHENGTAGYVLERDEDGNPTKEVKYGVPIDLSADEKSKLESFGAVFADSSAKEHKEYEESQEGAPVVGADVAAAAPRIGGAPNQPNQSDADSSDDDK